MTAHELKRELECGNPVVVVEILPPSYFRHSHLPGALNLSPDEVLAKAAAVFPDKSQEIVVYCLDAACPAAARALVQLKGIGYENVRELDGGKAAWREAGFPLEGAARAHQSK